MTSTIQGALKNVVSKEVESLKKYDWLNPEGIDDGIYYLVSGALIGLAATSVVIDAGGVSQLPSFVEAKSEIAQAFGMEIVANYGDVMMGIGSSMASIGAMIFLKGLKEDNELIRSRADHAFNKLGHGINYIEAIESTYDNLISNKAALKEVSKEIDAEMEWISTVVRNPNRSQADALASVGLYHREKASLEIFKNAYIHGVKKYFAENALNDKVIKNHLGNPTHYQEIAILKGMTDYYAAASIKEPGIFRKLGYVLGGDPSILKSQEKAGGMATEALNLVLKLKGKPINRNRERIYDSGHTLG